MISLFPLLSSLMLDRKIWYPGPLVSMLLGLCFWIGSMRLFQVATCKLFHLVKWGGKYLTPWVELLVSHFSNSVTQTETYLDLVDGWRDICVFLHLLQVSWSTLASALSPSTPPMKSINDSLVRNPNSLRFTLLHQLLHLFPLLPPLLRPSTRSMNQE